ncbi:MAG: TolB family protein, partial [Thermoleophilia bacterium]
MNRSVTNLRALRREGKKSLNRIIIAAALGFVVVMLFVVTAAQAGTGIISRVSTDSLGAQATGGGSYYPAISADGRYVTFFSDATNLVTGDGNALTDVFVKDTQTGAITRVSTDSGGAQATGGGSYSPAISADGRYVTFFSDATNLVTGDGNALTDVFVKDTQTGATTRVSTDSLGAQGNGNSGELAIS